MRNDGRVKSDLDVISQDFGSLKNPMFFFFFPRSMVYDDGLSG